MVSGSGWPQDEHVERRIILPQRSGPGYEVSGKSAMHTRFCTEHRAESCGCPGLGVVEAAGLR
jgi:hypothetical protein